MSLILSGTDGLSDIDGSAATPAIRGTDANTGIFFPAADTIAFAEGGAEVMRIDSAGNLGLGVVPSANFMLEAGSTASPAARSFKLMTLTGGFSGGNYPLFGYNFRSTATSGVYKYDASDTASAINYSGAMSFLLAPSGTAGNNITWTTAMTLDASGNLLVGTTSQLINNARFSAQGVYTSDSNTTTYSTQRAAAVLRQDGGSGSNNQGSYSALVLSTNVGAAINPGVLMRGYGGSSGTTYNIQINENGNITNTNNSYGSLSDESLKENIVDATPKLNDLMAVQVRGYNLKNDEKKTKQLGVIAQELETVFPSMVEVEPDGLKSVKYSVFVPMLIKALQEQQALITTLTGRITALENK